MRPFRWPVIGGLWAAGMTPSAFRFLMKLQGIGDFSQVSKAEINTYLTLMKRDDRGRAFRKVSRSAQTTAEKQELYHQVVRSRSYPVQIVWTAQDPAMPIGTYGEKARAAVGLAVIDRIPGKHFPQEDHAPAIATRVASIALARKKNAPNSCTLPVGPAVQRSPNAHTTRHENYRINGMPTKASRTYSHAADSTAEMLAAEIS